MKELRFICKKCGEEAEEDKARSTSQWKVYETKCKCGNKDFKLDL